MEKRSASFVGLVVLALMTSVADVNAAAPDASVKKTFDKILGALQANDRDAFLAMTTDAVKDGLTQEVMDGLSKNLGRRLKKGYEPTYLCQLKQAGLQVHLWKVTFKDGGDDVIVRVGLKGGKVDGFFLQ